MDTSDTLINQTNYEIENWARYISCTSIIIFISFLFLGLVLSIIGGSFVVPHDISQNSFSNKKNSRFVSVITLLLISLDVINVFFWIDYIYSNQLFSLYEFKISLLFSAIAILLLLSASIKSPSRILNNLIELRRELILGVLPTENIKHQLDFIFRGLKIDDYYSEECSEILISLQQFDKEIYLASQKVNLFYIKSQDIDDIVERNLTQDALMESIMLHQINAAQIMFTQIEKVEKKLNRKIMLVRVYNKNSNTEKIKEIFETIDLSKLNYNDLVRKWYEILQEVNNQESSKKMILELMGTVPRLKFDIKTGNPIK
ncbi:hypothetical protein AAEO57_19525 [Flavobacterium sp. DGU38]|uniref:Phage abortive infection protein n=1 Tax=Flavobacterium calami TaxID=3139144 RepID=A0ABU9IU68_9FLAO